VNPDRSAQIGAADCGANGGRSLHWRQQPTAPNQARANSPVEAASLLLAAYLHRAPVIVLGSNNPLRGQRLVAPMKVAH